MHYTQTKVPLLIFQMIKLYSKSKPKYLTFFQELILIYNKYQDTDLPLRVIYQWDMFKIRHNSSRE